MHDDHQLPGTPLFDEDNDGSDLERHMTGPSEATSRLIAQHLDECQTQGRAPYWPDWDE